MPRCTTRPLLWTVSPERSEIGELVVRRLDRCSEPLPQQLSRRVAREVERGDARVGEGEGAVAARARADAEVGSAARAARAASQEAEPARPLRVVELVEHLPQPLRLLRHLRVHRRRRAAARDERAAHRSARPLCLQLVRSEQKKVRRRPAARERVRRVDVAWGDGVYEPL
eukprot:CAMPEP_0202757386 /NCGR_PEP_ID=MMETSP1388-20130828/16340_1 /ASSEMBLY_ACC=CAM_ASM_000864 /TAXON_ID=37098 /ORGANISM="Isochrysis sp, Strain CCMP1244" /LENGTH=170 /DNA_ID=CAMNT_0049425277 /DNA_START=101 /DNA_END=609 /DNA_ORIENTATION=+